MGVLGEGSWCFCSGGGRSERVKAGIFSGKGHAMAWLPGGGTGFLIHRGLLLTTHVCLPSVAAAEDAEIRIHQGRVSARLVPHRFFITSTILDLTIVGLDMLETESSSHAQQPYHLKTCCSPNLELGSTVYLLGFTDKKELTIGEGKVVIGTDNLIKLSTDGITWCPGSAGFDVHGNLAFMVCDPMKLASSPAAKCSSTSSSSSNSTKKDVPMLFGIPIPIICDWLYQHWEGSLDELSKPKLPLMRLMSTGQKSDHSSASFAMRRVFKSNDSENDDMRSSSQTVSRPLQQLGVCSINPIAAKEQNALTDVRSTRDQGIPTPEIYETRKMISGPLRDRHPALQLLDINFPPRAPRTASLLLPERQLLAEQCGDNVDEEPEYAKPSKEADSSQEMRPTDPVDCAELFPPRPTQEDCHSEVESSSSPLGAPALPNEEGSFSEGETMYSAETMESRNFPSPRQERPQQVGRSQSCMSYNRWGATQRSSTSGKTLLQKQHSLTPVRKTHSQTAAASHKSHDYHSPTVASAMKKRNGAGPTNRSRQSVAQVSPRWI